MTSVSPSQRPRAPQLDSVPPASKVEPCRQADRRTRPCCLFLAESCPARSIAFRRFRRQVRHTWFVLECLAGYLLGWPVGLSGELHRAREDERKAGVKSSDFRSSRMPSEARESCDRWLVPCGVASES